jgi:hypothetical protein
MSKLVKIKPIIFLGLFIALIIVFFTSLSLLVNLTNERIGIGSLYLFLIVFLFLFFCWIYLLGCGFDLLNKNNNINSSLRKFRVNIILSYKTYLTSVIIEFYNAELDSNLLEYLNVILNMAFLFFFFVIVKELTTNFRFYDKKSEPRIIDYFITFFLVCFFPFGLLILHSHLRLFLKEHSLISMN